MSTKQTEDLMYNIVRELEETGLRRQFDAQLSKMAKQDKHKWKEIGERWEYAIQKVRTKHAKSDKRATKRNRKNSKDEE
jgi:hypothetical protein